MQGLILYWKMNDAWYMHFYECRMVNILRFKEKVKHEAIAYENEHQEHTSINMIYRRDLNEQYSIHYHPTIKMKSIMNYLQDIISQM